MLAESASDATLARNLVRQSRTATLATMTPDGGPFASYIITAPASDGSPLTLLSRLAVHTKNILHDPRASLLFVREAESEALAASRLTLTGQMVKEGDAELKRAFLEQRPDASRYAGFPDFSLYRFDISAGHLVAGFGRIVDLSAADLLQRV